MISQPQKDQCLQFYCLGKVTKCWERLKNSLVSTTSSYWILKEKRKTGEKRGERLPRQKRDILCRLGRDVSQGSVSVVYVTTCECLVSPKGRGGLQLVIWKRCGSKLPMIGQHLLHCNRCDSSKWLNQHLETPSLSRRIPLGSVSRCWGWVAAFSIWSCAILTAYFSLS